MANSADPDQLASSEANWSGSALFAKQDIYGFSRTRVKHPCDLGAWQPGSQEWVSWSSLVICESVGHAHRTHLISLSILVICEHDVLWAWCPWWQDLASLTNLPFVNVFALIKGHYHSAHTCNHVSLNHRIQPIRASLLAVSMSALITGPITNSQMVLKILQIS